MKKRTKSAMAIFSTIGLVGAMVIPSMAIAEEPEVQSHIFNEKSVFDIPVCDHFYNEEQMNKYCVGNVTKSMSEDSSKWYSGYFERKEAAEMARIEAEKAAQMSQVTSYSGGSSSYTPSNGGGLTKSGGVNYFNGRRETWYSTRESGQTVTAYPIPGKNVGSDGVIRDKDGYICVAASDLPAGHVVETSLGTGKVYDTGCASGTTDIYVDW